MCCTRNQKMWLFAQGFWISTRRLDKLRSVLPANRAWDPSGYLHAPLNLYSVTGKQCFLFHHQRALLRSGFVQSAQGLGNLAAQKKSNTLGYKKLAVQQQLMFYGTALQILQVRQKHTHVLCRPPSTGNFHKETQQAAHTQKYKMVMYWLMHSVST